MRLTVFAAAVSACIIGIAAAGEAQAAIRHDTHIAAQPLAKALSALAKERQFQVLFRSDLVRGLQTSGASGELTDTEALTQLLSGTALGFQFLDEKTVTIVPLGKTEGSAPSQDPSDENTRNNTGDGGMGSDSAPNQLRLAQADQAVPAESSPSQERLQSSPKSNPSALDEVVVTGTNIRGATNDTSPVLQYQRADIEKMPYTTTADFIASIPQFFGGGQHGASPDGVLGQNGGNNTTHAVAANLRGLGEQDTLTLLNGHRLAPGDFGDVIDISVIPLAAIERVDVLTDGASAIYGSDAVAGVVNFVLRKNYDGAETNLNVGSVTRGGMQQETLDQTYGKSWSSGSFLIAYRYQHQSALSSTARTFTSEAAEPTNIYNPYSQSSLVLNANQALGDKLSVFADAFASWQKTGSLYSYGPGRETDNFGNPRSATLNSGLRYSAPADWVVEASGLYSTTYQDLGDKVSPFTTIVGKYTDFSHTSLYSGDLNASGPLLRLPGGSASLAIGGSFRHELASNINTIPGDVSGQAARQVKSGFAELLLPITQADNGIPLLGKITLSAAARIDDYSDFGSSTNPKVGVSWAPVPDLTLRASWGRAFRAPSIGDRLYGNQLGFSIFNYPFTSPNGVGTVPIFILQGSDPNLGPEKAKTLSGGFDFLPAAVPNAKFTLDIYDIDFRDRIVTPPFNVNALTQPNVYGPLIRSLADDAAAAAVLANALSRGANYYDILGTGSAGIRYVYNAATQNAAIVKQSGLDVSARYLLTIAQNKFTANVMAAYIREIDTAYSATSLAHDIANTYGNPSRFRMRGQLGWERGRWQVNTAVNFTNAYRDDLVIPEARVSSYTTVDMTVRYDLPAQQGPMSGTSLGLNVINLFAADPPYTAAYGLSGVNYDVGNASPLGRFVSLQLRKKW